MVRLFHAYSYRGGNCYCLLSHTARWFPIAKENQVQNVKKSLEEQQHKTDDVWKGVTHFQL